MTAHIDELLESLPDSAGVYLHKDGEGRVLYVGKAKSLRSRVRSYFQPSAEHTPRIHAMVRQVRDIEILKTRTEAEALLLEANLIKKHKPRYNINYKDDKSYPFFKLTVDEDYPRLYLTREKHDRHAEYYGPYPSVKDARATMAMIRRHFRLCSSKLRLGHTSSRRACMDYHLGRCLGPCRGLDVREPYREEVNKVRLFLQGRDKELLQRLEAEMNTAAAGQRYEEAAARRDAIGAVRRTLDKQRVLIPDERLHQDVFALARQYHLAGVQILFVRRGRLIGSDFRLLERTEGMDDGEILKSVLTRIYTRPSAIVPHEVLLAAHFDEQEIVEAFLGEKRGGRVRLRVPRQGPKRKLVDMAAENARHALAERMAARLDDRQVLREVQRELHLRREPYRVEAFDISNIQGTHAVASMVVFEENRPHKDAYRKYRIKTVQGPDDFRSMFEVLARRYRRAASGEQPLPELILIDGGKGQVNLAAQVLEHLGIGPTDVDLIGLAKGRAEKRRGGRRVGEVDYEYVVKPTMKNEHPLKRNSTTLHFLQRIRDEAHRFAVTYHRQTRSRGTLRTSLQELPGIGPKRARELLRHFGSLRQLREASLAELLEVPGLPQSVAEALYASLHGEGAALEDGTGEEAAEAAADEAEDAWEPDGADAPEAAPEPPPDATTRPA